jgi:hypothetical protein
MSSLISGATRSAFRLETLPQYLVSQDIDAFAAWKSGMPLPASTPETSPYLAAVQKRTQAGCRRYRVHILDYPLSEYSRYELDAYRPNQAAGEEIYLADRASHAALRDLHEDFWLIDDEILIRMIYDDEGRFLGPERVQDMRPYLDMRDTALRHSQSMEDFLAAKES